MAEHTDEERRSKLVHLARIIELGLASSEPLSAGELRKLLEYELAAPISFDLRCLDSGQAARLRTATGSSGLLLKSLRDLLQHPQPLWTCCG